MTASLKSPRIVANSARRRCCDGGTGPPFTMGRVADRVICVTAGTGVGAGEGDGDPKRRRVEENNLEGSLRVDEN